MSQNPYTTLGVSSDASEEDIKKAYRSLVKQYHPDLHPGDEAAAKKMSEINEAYELIRSGNAPKFASGANGTSGTSPGNGMSGSFDRNGETFYYSYMDPDDILEAIFGSLGSFSRYGHTDAFRTAPDDYDLYELFEKYFDRGSFHQAAAVLNAISQKDARWHFCAARFCFENGNLYEAQSHAEWAVSLDPGSSRYKELYDKIEETCETAARRSRLSRILMSAIGFFFAALFIFQLIRPLIETYFGTAV
ncbi:MAG: DnaJ domain-containing protein [Ruminococcus sp.]|nr:DnaJ domain-containing protein [Ruminococcus sp.]